MKKGQIVSRFFKDFCKFIFIIIIILKHGRNVFFTMSVQGGKRSMKLSEEDYNYWRHLARDYYEQQERKSRESNIQQKEWECIQALCEEFEHEKKITRQVKGKVNEIEIILKQMQVNLESIKHLSMTNAFDSCVTKSIHPIHYLARYSPYPETNVQRVPISDKYVSWEVMWIDYDPVAYTKPKTNFPQDLQDFVDDDILLLQELQIEEISSKIPVLKWNSRVTNPAGITIDRQSWIMNEEGTNLLYKLDNGIPQNPYGRTGLRGRGTLPRWGPNHYVILIVTRYNYNI